MKDCIEHKEPILLVGEPGTSKTLMCEYFAQLYKKKLYILNCHQHSEVSDFIGSLRPNRLKSFYYHFIILPKFFSEISEIFYLLRLKDNKT